MVAFASGPYHREPAVFGHLDRDCSHSTGRTVNHNRLALLEADAGLTPVCVAIDRHDQCV